MSGQTGSGKTFTITGGPSRYEDRGLIPRTLAYVFNETEKRANLHYDISISYLEIYNNSGYDLLDPNHDSKKLEDLPKVFSQLSLSLSLSLSLLSLCVSSVDINIYLSVSLYVYVCI